MQTGRESGRFGNAHATVVPYQLFDTKDASLALACGNDGQFKALCEKVLERPEWAADERFAKNRDRVHNRETLIPLLSEVFRSRETGEWLRKLREAKVPAGRVRAVSEVFGSDDVAARGLVQEMPDSVHGSVRLVRSPLRFSESPLKEPVAPPRLGEHTEEVLAWLEEQEG